MLKTKKLIVKQ